MDFKKLFPIFFDNVPLSIIWIDLNGVIRDSNSTTEKILGYTNERLVNQNFEDIFTHPKEFSSVFQDMIEAIRKGEFIEPLEIQVFKDDGTLIWVNFQCRSIQLGGETIIQVIIQDITEYKQVERVIKEEKLKIEGFFDELREVIHYISLFDGIYIYFSPSGEIATGYTQEEFLANPLLIKEIKNPDLIELYRGKWADLTKGKISPTCEYKIVDSGGSEMWILQLKKGIVDEKSTMMTKDRICGESIAQKQVE